MAYFRFDLHRSRMIQTSLPAFATGFALSGALIVAIGAQNMFVLRQGLRREHVGPVVAFCACADAMLIGAGVAGLGALLGAIPALSRVLLLGGAGFLLWYGISALRRALDPGSMALGGGGLVPSLATTIGRTAAFTLLNPHVYLDTVLLMGSIGASQPGHGQIFFVMGAATASVLWFTGLGYGARLLAPLFERPAAWRVLDAVVAVTMLLLAAGLLLRGWVA
jgi:L-lysine exporter family protein LysE/ArgO